jgi:cyclopropane-fatty-acyl-phospholipid synthase
MTYSSAYFGNKNFDLHRAQENKYQNILNKLVGKNILEIGCGWGGFAEMAVKAGYDLKCLTISQKQYEYATGKATFLENYLSEYGHLRGADTAWSKQKDTFLKQQYGPTGTTAKFSNGNPAPAPAVNPDIDALVNSYLNK